MRFRLPSRASDRPDRRPPWRRRGGRPGHRGTELVLGVLLAVLGACADAPTAPRAVVPGAPQRLLVAEGYTQVSVGPFHNCAVTSAGALACWGDDYAGRATPPAGTGYTQVSVASFHSCAVTSAGALACWGSNNNGQATPPQGTGYTQVATGRFHSCALTSAGALACWGSNSDGQATPPAGTGYTQVSAGAFHSCALTSAGTLACWGWNDDGQATPPQGTGYTQVSAGGVHSCALTSAGALACWGNNGAGQAAPPAGTGYTQVSAGTDLHGCAVTSAGALVCWGRNTDGRATPPQGAGYAQVGAGYAHGCAVTSAGALACWGLNNDGQATPPSVPAPTHVLPTATFTAPATAVAGQSFTLALTDAQVPGHPEATVFTFAFDCGDGAGYAAAASAATTSCPTTAAGPRAVRGQVIDQDGDTASYAATVDVVRAAQTVAFTSTPPSPASVGGTYAVSASATSGLPATITSLTPAVCTVAGGTATFAAAGPCTLAADQAGDARYLAAPQVTQTIAVAKIDQTITFTSAPPSPALVGGTYAVSATGGASGNPVTFGTLTPATCTVTGGTVRFVVAGTCTVAADQAGSATYNPAPQQAQTFTVAVPPPPPPAFPRTAVLDRFARANGALGGAWGGFSAPAFFQISSQQGAAVLGGGIGWAAGAFGTTQEAFVTLSALGGGTSAGGAQGLVLKGQDPRDHTLGALTVTYDPKAGVVRVGALRVKPAAVTAYPAVAVRFAAGDQLGARATAAGTVEVYRNGTLVGTVTLNAADKSYFATRGGYVGLLYVAAPGARFDDFGGGSVAP